MLTKISHVDIVTEDGVIEEGELYIRDGKIAHIGHEPGLAAEVSWDGGGHTLIPGFIDAHVHGGAGYDFMDHTSVAADAICQFHASHGTTSLLATTITASFEALREVLDFYKGYRNAVGAEIIGVHLEGPFINRKYKGAQNEEWIVPATCQRLERLWQWAGDGLIRMVTWAPELVEEDVLKWLQRKNVILAAGHTDLDYEEGCRCIRQGSFNHATHLGNAMRSFHHRNIGPIGIVMENPEVTFDVIADGIHLAPAFIRLLARVCSPEQWMLITDAMRAAGLHDGTYDLGGQQVVVKNGEARLHSGVLAGSLLTLDRALANLIKYTDMPLVEAIRYLTINPAKRLRVDQQKGSIRVGKDADLVLISKDIQVQATWVGGHLVYEKS